MKDLERRKKCREHRSIKMQSSEINILTPRPLTEHFSVRAKELDTETEDFHCEFDKNAADWQVSTQKSFKFDANNFTEEQFHMHVLKLGPHDRYFYFRDEHSRSLYNFSDDQ